MLQNYHVTLKWLIMFMIVLNSYIQHLCNSLKSFPNFEFIAAKKMQVHYYPPLIHISISAMKNLISLMFINNHAIALTIMFQIPLKHLSAFKLTVFCWKTVEMKIISSASKIIFLINHALVWKEKGRTFMKVHIKIHLVHSIMCI